MSIPFPRRTLLRAAVMAPIVFGGTALGQDVPDGTDTAMEPAALGRAITRAATLDQLHSLIIARNGEIAFAEAFRGPGLDRVANVKSVSKTIVAALAGVALDRGVLTGVDQPMAGPLADLIPAEADPRVYEITIADLLTMQAGLERTSGPNYGRWVSSRDWIAYVLSRPFETEPGAQMLYSTGSYHLMGAVLAEATGQSLLSLARDWLGEPLGIEIPPWVRDPQGFYMGGNDMALSPMALLRFGEMARLSGLWQQTRVVSEDWIEQSWTPRTRSPWSGHAYGYGWFLALARGHNVAYARGYGGQMLYLVPSLDLTVVVTS
ncbi:MAG: serine hydrolase, partial [Pseudomonadota bacterium]